MRTLVYISYTQNNALIYIRVPFSFAFYVVGVMFRYNPIRPWYPQPQFWYFGNPQPLKPTWPVGDPDDYKFEKLPYPSEGVTILEKMEIERPERYLPGEIYRAEPVKRPIEDLSKSAK